MKVDQFKKAKSEARRFLETCTALEKSQSDVITRGYGFDGSKESGAVKRASLDLTRALAELRK